MMEWIIGIAVSILVVIFVWKTLDKIFGKK